MNYKILTGLLLVLACLGSAHAQEIAKTIQEHSLSTNARSAIAQSEKLRQADKTSEAIQSLEEFTQNEPDPIVLFTLGNHYFLNDQPGKSISPYQKALSQIPVYPTCRRNLGRAYFALQRYRPAAQEFRVVINQNQSDSEALTLLGRSYYRLGNTSGAIEALKRALFYEPEKAEPRIWLIRYFYIETRYREAQLLCEESLRLHPTNPTLLELLGNICIANEQYGPAIDIFKLLQLIGQVKPKMLLTLGDLYMNQKMYLEAAETYESAFKQKEPNANDLLRLAQAKWFGQDLKSALLICNEVLSLSPKSYQAYLLKGQILVESDDDQAALEAFQKVNSLKAGIGEAFLGLGQIYLKQAEYLEAKKHFQSAAKIKHTAAAGLAGLGEVAYAQDKINQSIKYYQKALSLEPRNKYYYDMLVELQKIQRYAEAED